MKGQRAAKIREVVIKDKESQDSPVRFDDQLVAIGSTPFAEVIIGGELVVRDSNAISMLPDVALIALDEQSVRRVGLVVLALVFLKPTNAPGYLLVFL